MPVSQWNDREAISPAYKVPKFRTLFAEKEDRRSMSASLTRGIPFFPRYHPMSQWILQIFKGQSLHLVCQPEAGIRTTLKTSCPCSTLSSFLLKPSCPSLNSATYARAERIYEKALHRALDYWDAIEERILIDVRFHGMTAEYHIFLENWSFFFLFLQILFDVRFHGINLSPNCCTNKSVRPSPTSRPISQFLVVEEVPRCDP